MAVRDDFSAGEVLAAADLNDTFASKLPIAGKGNITQIVRATDSTDRTTTSSSLVDVTGMSVTITPQASDSAIMIVASLRVEVNEGDSFGGAQFTITDSSNNAISGSENQRTNYVIGSATSLLIEMPVLIVAYATPATTSATTYKLRFLAAGGSDVTVENSQNTGQMYAIEVSA